MTKLLAFHNDPAIKQKYLDRVRWHREQDNLIQGTGWERGKGCAIGCTLEDYDHNRYPTELGLPVWLAHLEDRIFEGLSKEEAMTWPERFLAAIPVGADVEPVRHHLAIRRIDRLIELQSENWDSTPKEYGLKGAIISTLTALSRVRACHEAELSGVECNWSEAESEAARSAALAAESARSAWAAAARSAALAAESARSAALAAARSASRSAWSVAWSAAWSARAAGWATEAAAHAMGAESGAAAWKQEAEDLLELLENC